MTARDSPKSNVRNVKPALQAQTAPQPAETKKVPVVVVDHHDNEQDAKTGDKREAKQQNNKDGGPEDDVNETGAHSGK